MEDTRISKMVYEWKLEGRRGRGTWEQNIQQSMRNLGVTADDAEDSGEN